MRAMIGLWAGVLATAVQAATTVSVPVTGSGIAADGRPVTVSGIVTVTIGDPPPPPVPVLTVFQVLGSNPVSGPGATTVGVTVAAPVPSDTLLVIITGNPLVRADPLVIRAGSAEGSASLYVGAVPTGTTVTVPISVTLGTVTKTLALMVLGASGPAIQGYATPEGGPLPVGGSWVGSALMIDGQGLGTEGQVTWSGIEQVSLAWADRQIEITLSFAAPAPGIAPVVVKRSDGVTITGPPLSVLTQPVGTAMPPPGSRVRQGR